MDVSINPDAVAKGASAIAQVGNELGQLSSNFIDIGIKNPSCETSAAIAEIEAEYAQFLEHSGAQWLKTADLLQLSAKAMVTADQAATADVQKWSI